MPGWPIRFLCTTFWIGGAWLANPTGRDRAYADAPLVREIPPGPLYGRVTLCVPPADRSPVRIVLAVGENERLRLTIAHDAARTEEMRDGAWHAVGKPRPHTPAPTFAFFSRRDRVLRLYLDHQAVATAADIAADAPLRIAAEASAATGIHHLRLGPIRMSDDFMRVHVGLEDAWHPEAGWWRVRFEEQNHSPNPFVCVGSATGAGGRLLTGHPFWNHLEAAVALRPLDGAEAGLIFGYQDERHYARAVVSARNGGSLRIERIEGGQPRLLARRALRGPDRHWSRLGLRVEEGGRVIARLDGETALTVAADWNTFGKIGLFVNRGTAHFDDFHVAAIAAASDDPAVLPALRTVSRLADTVVPDRYGRIRQGDLHLLRWVESRSFWTRRTLRLHRRAYSGKQFAMPLFGDFRFAADSFAMPRRWVLLDDAGAPLHDWTQSAGEPLVIERRNARLFANGTAVADLPVDRPVQLFQRYPGIGGGSIHLNQKEEAFHLHSARLRSETFENAPTDWFPVSGVWENSSRWQCNPGWTFFSGVGYEDAILMSKRHYGGDQIHEIWFALKDMLGRRYELRRYIRRDIAVSFCTDGRDVFSGYTVLLGGFGNSGAYLYRGRERVAVNEKIRFRPFRGRHSMGDEHLPWHALRLERANGRLRVTYDNQTVFDEPDGGDAVAAGGHLAIWTVRNGLMLGRVTSAAQTIETRAADYLFGDDPGRAAGWSFFAEKLLRREPRRAGGWTALEPHRVHTEGNAGGRTTVRNLYGGGRFAVEWPLTGVFHALDVRRNPTLDIWLDVPAHVKIAFHLRVNGRNFIYPVTASGEHTYSHLADEKAQWGQVQPAWRPLVAPPLDALVQGEAVDRFQGVFTIPLLQDMQVHFAGAPEIALDRIILGNTSQHEYLMAGLNGNAAGTAYVVGPLQIRK